MNKIAAGGIAIMVGTGFVLLVGIPITLWYAYAFHKIWEWHLTAYWPAPETRTVAAAMFLYSLVRRAETKSDDKDAAGWAKILYWLLWPALAMLCAWVLR